jgi:hypothetical protein
MAPCYLTGQVLKVTIGNFHTYGIIIPHIFEHQMGFKSLIADESRFSISVDQLEYMKYR